MCCACRRVDLPLWLQTRPFPSLVFAPFVCPPLPPSPPLQSQERLEGPPLRAWLDKVKVRKGGGAKNAYEVLVAGVRGQESCPYGDEGEGPPLRERLDKAKVKRRGEGGGVT